MTFETQILDSDSILRVSVFIRACNTIVKHSQLIPIIYQSLHSFNGRGPLKSTQLVRFYHIPHLQTLLQAFGISRYQF